MASLIGARASMCRACGKKYCCRPSDGWSHCCLGRLGTGATRPRICMCDRWTLTSCNWDRAKDAIARRVAVDETKGEADNPIVLG